MALTECLKIEIPNSAKMKAVWMSGCCTLKQNYFVNVLLNCCYPFDSCSHDMNMPARRLRSY